ncbi:YqhA family protein [Roseomonas sp. KE0001]|uniref:YqhA family protein n=1 Tax=Roseomonas sp. KE0001 TaxID=2479201 RepID=UPI0018DEF136|nr:YqhA family protein [Roseomonas sp. KE0001]MBI0433688.1 YqhA family protein [Roseomonas sp. KE0001]
MIQRLLSVSRFIMIIPFAVTLACSFVMLFYQSAVTIASAIELAQRGEVNQTVMKIFAVEVIQAIDVFLIAIASYITSIGLYTLFIDEKLPRPSWLRLQNLEDLKDNLISVVIAVLAVLFLREAVAWEGDLGIVSFGAACALVIASLVFFLVKSRGSDD